MRSLTSLYAAYAGYIPKVPGELYDNIMAEKNLSRLIDLISFNTYFKVEDKQELLEILAEDIYRLNIGLRLELGYDFI